MAARAQMLTEIILPALDRGETVISDRYLLATMAYQGHGSGLDIPELRQATLFAAGGLLPDLSFVLDISVATARGRLGANPDRLESRPHEYHERVRQGFLIEASRDTDRIVVVSAEASTEAVHTAVLSAFKTWRARHELA
jgi:dTMP kinase